MDLSAVRIVIPHRGIHDGKARLADVLTPDNRAQLNKFMLVQVARATRAVVSDVVLISPDGSMDQTAARLGLGFSRQSGGTGMNHALEQATTDAIADGIDTLGIISADLPQITSADVKALLRAAQEGTEVSVTIASDAAERGTNALVVRPPGAIPLRFGTESRAAHADEARKRAVPIFVVHRPGLARDIDVRADFVAWARGHPARWHQALFYPANTTASPDTIRAEVLPS